MNIISTETPISSSEYFEGQNKKSSLKNKLSKNLLHDIQNSEKHSEAKKVAKKVKHIWDLDKIYEAYEDNFANMIARYAIKQIIDHEVKYGQYWYLHDVLLPHPYLNEQEKHRVEENIDKAALNYIKQHTKPFYQTTERFNNQQSVREFQQLVKIIYTDYISQNVRKKAEKLVLKRVKNKKEHSEFLLFVKNNENLSENMKRTASQSLDEKDKI
ncbi:MAG TPA: hypothetical protein PK674_00915 [Candidatus Absconditabacterales bacterium]|jgi:hypothetical protein|uniref:Uncharacterized protein n=1 Tax=candidate division CPR1 bacterium ADurb.Bin160 TaxID=1852826 RepID=A0A1V5ZR14_9BACT|nr:MAG: hypothetical protein BWY04_00073 [candidate division CPR1 bacterium ADurb.Bin160]HOG15125.1 hypothetical protein [Candidatus Absconditabacterales bacterium]HOQ78879.1 hypothetical protein [Candidatus Absconditabacterales bacterium]HPK27961.1 hypothetical protein [Candidatus Absconditabacterales bacterium]